MGSAYSTHVGVKLLSIFMREIDMAGQKPRKCIFKNPRFNIVNWMQLAHNMAAFFDSGNVHGVAERAICN